MKLVGKFWMVLLVLPLVFLSMGQNCDSTVNHQLQVSRYTTASLTNARADQILAAMSTILQTNDGAGDVACDVAFILTGNVTAFTTGNGSINSSADFSAVIGLPGWVKIVNQINWCGGLAPNIIGCAPIGGTSFVAVRFTANQEGVLWVHEFGHDQDLGHRNEPFAVMAPAIGPNNKRVNSAECDAYKVATVTSELTAK